MDDSIEIRGAEYRVVVNWNSFVAFLKFVGRDTLEDAQGGFGAPSDIAPLIAACLNEGCRIDGKEERFTPEDVGEVLTPAIIERFMQIYAAASTPGTSGREAKKK
jgi:hypothetical protein